MPDNVTTGYGQVGKQVSAPVLLDSYTNWVQDEHL